MAARKLTQIVVENAKPRSDGAGAAIRTEYPDAGLPLLYLIVQPSGGRSWALRYRFNKKPKKLTLGLVAELTLSAARKAATAAQHEIEQGNDPAAGKQATRAAVQLTGLHTPDSVEVLAGQFIELHARRKVRPSTLYQYESIFHRLVLPVWRERSVHDVRRRDVIALVEAIADERGGYMANRTLGLLSKFFAWLMARDIVAVSPVHGVERPHKEVARDRALSDDEVARLWAACGDEGVFGAAIRMMVLTGCRRREVAEMRWDEVDAERRLWTLPAARSKSRHSSCPVGTGSLGRYQLSAAHRRLRLQHHGRSSHRQFRQGQEPARR